VKDEEEDVHIHRGSQHTTPVHRVSRSVVEAPRHGALAERGAQVKTHNILISLSLRTSDYLSEVGERLKIKSRCYGSEDFGERCEQVGMKSDPRFPQGIYLGPQ